MALRRNHGKKVSSDFAEDLNQSLDKSMDSIRLLSLEDTDLLWTKFNSNWQLCVDCSINCFNNSWYSNETDNLRSILQKLSDGVNNATLIMFRPLSVYCGAIEIRSNEVFERIFRLVSLDQDDLLIANQDGSHGLALSLNTEKRDTADVGVYELVIWGQEWLQVLSVVNF